MRFTENDVQDYISRSKKGQSAIHSSSGISDFSLLGIDKKQDGFIICGQDLILDILSNYMRLHDIPPSGHILEVMTV